MKQRMVLEPRKKQYNRVIRNPEFNILGSFRKLDTNRYKLRRVVFKPSRDFQDNWLFKREIDCMGLGENKTLYITSNKGKFYITDNQTMLPHDVETSKILDEILNCDQCVFKPYNRNENESEFMRRSEIYRQVGELQDWLLNLINFLKENRWDDLRCLYKKREKKSGK